MGTSSSEAVELWYETPGLPGLRYVGQYFCEEEARRVAAHLDIPEEQIKLMPAINLFEMYNIEKAPRG